MNVKQGDLVKVDGKEAIVECFWGAGKHRVFKLNDGREVLDLTDESIVVPVQEINIGNEMINTERVEEIVNVIDPPKKKWNL